MIGDEEAMVYLFLRCIDVVDEQSSVGRGRM